MSTNKNIEPSDLAKLVAATGATIILRDVIIGDMHFPEIEIRPHQEVNIEATAVEFDGKDLAGLFAAAENGFAETPAEPAGETEKPKGQLIREWIDSAYPRKLIRATWLDHGPFGLESVKVEGGGVGIELFLSQNTEAEIVEILERIFAPKAPELPTLTGEHIKALRRTLGIYTPKRAPRNLIPVVSGSRAWVALMELREMGFVEKIPGSETATAEAFEATAKGFELMGFAPDKVEA